jgi:hypothetical protein
MGEDIRNQETTEKEALEEQVRDEAGEAVQAEAHEEDKPLDKMTVKDLREIAKVIPGVTGATAMKKDELISLIKEYRGIKDEEPVKKKKIKKTGLSIKDLKKKVSLLRKAKKAAQEGKDKGKVNILRMRINRLKKQTRKVVQA